MAEKKYSNLLYAIGHFLGDKFAKVEAGGDGGTFQKGFSISNPVGLAKGSVADGAKVTNVIKNMLTNRMSINMTFSHDADSWNERGKVVEVKKLTCNVVIPDGCSVQKMVFYDHTGAVVVGYYQARNGEAVENRPVSDGTITFDADNQPSAQTIYFTKPIVFGKTTKPDTNKTYVPTDFDATYDFKVEVYWTDNVGAESVMKGEAGVSWPYNTFFYGHITASTASAESQGWLKTLAGTVTKQWLFEQVDSANNCNGNLTREGNKSKSDLEKRRSVTFYPISTGKANWFIAVYPERWMKTDFHGSNGQMRVGDVEEPIAYNNNVPQAQPYDIAHLTDVRKWENDTARDADEKAYKEDYCVVVYGYKNGYADSSRTSRDTNVA